MLYGLVKIFIWSGRDLLQRQEAHEDMLGIDIEEEYHGGGGFNAGPSRQVRPHFYRHSNMEAIWDPREH